MKIYRLTSLNCIGWITPNGEIIKGSPKTTHEILARSLYKQLNIQQDIENNNLNPYDTINNYGIYTKLALSKNAVRFYLQYNLYIQATYSAIKNNIEKIIELAQNKTINVDITPNNQSYLNLTPQELMDIIYQ